MLAPLPANELFRLEALRRYQVLDTPPHESLDRLTKLAANLFNAPTALISLVDEQRQWFKSRVGWDIPESSRDNSFCAHALLGSETLVVLNALEDPRFAASPLVSGPAEIRFYVGALLTTREGFTLGTLCVLDKVPRQALDPEQLSRLEDLAIEVVDRLELTRVMRHVNEIEAHQASQLAWERERWQLALAANNDGLFDADLRAGTFVFSARWKEILGFRPNELSDTQQSFCDRVHPEDREMVDREMEVYLQGREPARPLEYRLRHRDGSWRWILARVQAVWDENGTPIRLVGSHSDVTARKLSEDRLKASEERYRDLFENNPLPAWVFDAATLQFLDVNQAAVLHFGYSAQEFLAMRLNTICPTVADRQISGDSLPHMRTGPWPHLKKDGTVLWAEVTSHAIYSAGRLVRMAIVQDVTEQRQAEQVLRESEARFRTLADSAPVLIWLAAPDLAYTWANQPWLAFTGRPLDAELGKGWTEGVHPEDLAQSKHLNTEAVQTRKPYQVEYRLRRHDGEWRTLLVHGSPRVAENGRFLGYIGSCVDITDHKALQNQLQQAAKMEAVGRLAGGVAHDFNNLLTVIIGHGEMLASGLSEQDPLHFSAEETLRAARRAANLTAQLLAFSRKQVLLPKVLDLNSIIRGMEDMLRRLLGEDIKFRVDLEQNLVPIQADPGQLEQVVMNLAVNARDAMPRGGRLVVSTRNLTDGDGVELSVSDNGQGMDPITQAHAFEPFFTTKALASGTGLGLAMVHGIVTQSGGTIELSSRLGEGTTFRITLPKSSREAAVPAAAEELADTAPLARGTILVVEDEAAVRGLVTRVLTRAGYSVLGASDAEEALRMERGHTGRIDLLVSDVVMPGLSGPEFAECLRLRRPGLPVLFMSGHTGHVALPETLPKSRTELIAKPFNPQGLLDRVRALIRPRSRGRNRSVPPNSSLLTAGRG